MIYAGKIDKEMEYNIKVDIRETVFGMLDYLNDLLYSHKLSKFVKGGATIFALPKLFI
jgi:hypothetical protein